MISVGTALRHAFSCSCIGALALTGAPAAAQFVVDPDLRLDRAVEGLVLPTGIAFLGPDDVLILEKQAGQVRRAIGGVLQATPVLDVPVNSMGERGLLGIAANSETPPKLFVYLTEATTDGDAPIAHRLYRYDWNPALGVLQSPQLLLNLPFNPDHSCHSGGVVTLGPVPPPGHGLPGDGAIVYVVIGDLGLPGQTSNSPMGTPPDNKAVIFAIQQDGSPAPGNPFVPYCSVTTTQSCPSGTGCPGGETCITQVARYFGYGVRNSFGMTFDPVTGRLWNTENGPLVYDEINIVDAGFNSGWTPIMGPDSRDPQGTGNLFHMPGAGITYSDPEFSWFRPIGVTAIHFTTGSQLGPGYDDSVLVGDNNFGQIYRLKLNATRDGFDFTEFPPLADQVADGMDGTERNLLLWGQGFGIVTDIERGPDGYLYVLSLAQGVLWRISPRCPRTPADCREPLVPGRSKLKVEHDPADETRNRLLWRWQQGQATAFADFGDPAATDSMRLCLYDGTGRLTDMGTEPGMTCDSRPCWSQDGTTHRYRDTGDIAAGFHSIVLRSGIDKHARISVRGRGSYLVLPDLSALVSPVSVRLHRQGSDQCWGATYSFPPAAGTSDTSFADFAD